MNSGIHKTGAACAFLCVITTIGIHSFFEGPNTFEEALQVYKTPMYIFSKWWVIFHCLFVIVSMYCVTKTTALKNKPFVGLAFTFYVGFGFFEIFRMTLVLNYLSMLRDQYVATADEGVKNILRVTMDSFNGTGSALFASFVICFLLGNFFLGLSFPTRGRFNKVLKFSLLFWSLMSVIFVTNEYLKFSFLESFFNYFNLIFQPAIRLALALYFIYDLRKLATCREKASAELIHESESG
jgi:hypothetical protein